MNQKITHQIEVSTQYIEQGRFIDAENILNSLLINDAHNFDALYIKGVLCGMLSRHIECKNNLLKAEKINPNHPFLQYNLAKALSELGEDGLAIKHHERVVGLMPTNPDAWFNYGKCLFNLNIFDDSLKAYNSAIKLKHDFADAYFNRGIVLNELKHDEEALKSYSKAIELKSDYAEAYSNLGVTYFKLDRIEEALASYEKAIELKSDYAEPHYNIGNALKEINQITNALVSYEKAIQIKSDYADAYSNRGNALIRVHRLDEALESYDKAIYYNPTLSEAYNNRGNVLKELKRLDEALESYDKAIAIKDDYAEAHNNRGTVLSEFGFLSDAIRSFDMAIKLKPNYGESYVNRGNALYELKIFDEALESYKRAFELNPSQDYLYGSLLHIKMFICDWRKFEDGLNELLIQINRNKKTSPCLPIVALTDSLSIQRQAAQIWIDDKYPISQINEFIFKKENSNSKIKIGYYSADFHSHATSYLMAELFEQHDKNNFKLIAFSFGPDSKDEMRQRLVLAFDQFIDVRYKSDKDVALMSREMGIDIAVDLKGFTTDARTGIFSYRAVPIQINYIGYPGTMAAEYIDYIIADPTLIPIESQRHYSEKVVYLPNSYQVNDRRREIDSKEFSRKELDLPQEGFVFCCFNNNYKITPHTFSSWIKILKAVEGSVLWLLEDNPFAAINLRKEAQDRGLDTRRLIFAKRSKLPEHLARHKVADLFLDTFPCNAHTTASDALWAGLPVLTCMGESFASRVAASLLNAIELPELITATQEQYETKAIELAKNPAKLKAIKDKLERNRLTTALFDMPRFTKHLEAAYTKMYERYQADLPPDHIYIQP